MAPFSSWPRGWVRECCPAGWPWIPTTTPNTFNWPLSRLRFCGWRTRIRPTLVSQPSYIGLSPATPSDREQWLLIFHTCDPSSVPSLQMVDGSLVTVLASLVLSYSLSSSTSEPGGLLSSPQRVPRCGLLCSSAFSLCSFPSISLSQYLPSRVSASIRYGWCCGWWRRSKVPVSGSFFGSLLDSPFFVLWQFPCWAPSLLAAVVSPCSRPWRAFCGSLLSLAVLAGLLPQLTTYDHCFTFVDFQATPLSSQ